MDIEKELGARLEYAKECVFEQKDWDSWSADLIGFIKKTVLESFKNGREAAKSKGKYGDSCAQTTHQTVGQRLGRFPANLLLDEEAAQQLDAQSGTLTSGKMKPGQQRNRSKGEGGYHGDFPDTATANGTYGDSGGASRFFYCSKASKKERGLGNDHPTVKPLDLMKYLLTLASTPTGGVILDPFAGSGTTLMAAEQLGRPCIGVELDAHHCEIAAARLNSLNRRPENGGHFALGA